MLPSWTNISTRACQHYVKRVQGQRKVVKSSRNVSVKMHSMHQGNAGEVKAFTKYNHKLIELVVI